MGCDARPALQMFKNSNMIGMKHVADAPRPDNLEAVTSQQTRAARIGDGPGPAVWEEYCKPDPKYLLTWSTTRGRSGALTILPAGTEMSSAP